MQLPIVRWEEEPDKDFFFDERLKQLRNVKNPHDFINLNDFEVEHYKSLKEWLLIGRLHADGRKENTWKNLQEHLKDKIFPIEDTKASINIGKEGKEELSKKLDDFNKKNQTDFFIDKVSCKAEKHDKCKKGD